MLTLTSQGGMKAVWNLHQKGIWKLLLTNWTELNSTEDESSSSKNQRPEEDLDPGLDPGLEAAPDLDLVAAQDLVTEAVTKVAPNQGAEADLLHRKTAPEAVQGQDLATGTRMMTERMEIAIPDLAQEIVEDLEADPDPEVQWKMMETKRRTALPKPARGQKKNQSYLKQQKGKQFLD